MLAYATGERQYLPFASVCIRWPAGAGAWQDAAVRWDRLFADLDAQLAAADAAELAGEVSDRTRREVSRLHLADRARYAIGAQVSVGLDAAGTASGRLEREGPGWWLLTGAAGIDQLVCTDAIAWVCGLPALSAAPGAQSVVEARLGLNYALRGIARDRSPVTVVLRDASSCAGTIDRVGADFLDLAEHAPGEPRRAGAVRSARSIALSAIAVVRSG